MLIRPKSQEAISADINFVAAGERRDFRRLRRMIRFLGVPAWSRAGIV